MLSPITPHFCSELWAGLVSAPGRALCASPFISWDDNVLKQKWPIVDQNYPLSFQCKVSVLKYLFYISITCSITIEQDYFIGHANFFF